MTIPTMVRFSICSPSSTGTVLSRKARPELCLAPARTARSKDGLGRVLGSPQIAGPRRQAPASARPRARGPRLDRLHRGHQDAVGHAVGAGRGQPEASACDRARSREHPLGFLHARRGDVRTVGHAGAGTRPEGRRKPDASLRTTSPTTARSPPFSRAAKSAQRGERPRVPRLGANPA